MSTVNPKQWSWTAASVNVDGSPIKAGEVTGYNIGVRLLAGTLAGTYPVVIPIADPNATSETFSAAMAAGMASLKDGDYQSAIQSTGPVNSAWSLESATSSFTVKTIPPTPQAPSGFTVG